MARFFRFAPAILIFAGVAVTAQSPGPLPQPHPPRPAQWQPKPQQMFVSYWTLEPGWTTQLEIRNNVAQRDLTVTPVLRTSAGREIPLQPRTVPPEHVEMIDLREAAASAAPELLDRADSFGSVVFRYGANSDANIFAASMVERSGTPVAFHFDERPIDSEWSSGAMESIWWLPRATASDYLILGNASSRPLVTSVVVSDLAGRVSRQNLSLGPAETTRLDVRAITQTAGLTGSQGGVSISIPTGAGALLASHIVFDETAGMSAIMKTFDRDPAEQPAPLTLRAPMMALSNPDPVLKFPQRTPLIPQLFLRNATRAPLSATLALNWRSSSGLNGRLPLPALSLAPGEIRTLELADFTAKGQLPADAYWGTVVLKYQGRHGDLVPVATSFDSSGRYGLQTPFSEGTAHLWKGSMWHVEPGRDSLITTGNGGPEPTHAAMTLFYNGGKSFYTLEKLLEPDEQLWIDVGELIRDQIPDKNGKTISPDVTMGSYELRDLDHRGFGYLYEGKLVLDKTWGHAYYGCAGCCAYVGTRLDPNPFSGAVNTGGYNEADAEDCTMTWYDFTDQADSWASANTAVATVDNAYTNFVGVGSTTGSTNLNLAHPPVRLNCPVYTFTPQNTVNVNSLSCSPASVTRGSQTTCTLQGPGTASNWKFTSSTISGATVSSASGSTSTTWSGTIVDSGTVTATATNGGSSTTVTASLTATARTSGFTYTMPPQPSAASVNGTCVGTVCLGTLSSPPSKTGEGTFGQSAYVGLPRFNTSASISSGPNQGYGYVTSISDSSQFIYELNPGLTNSSDPFYQAQYGKCGFASVADIVSAVQAHEYSGTPSHYSEVQAALASNNPGPVAERTIAPPGETQAEFITAVQNAINPIFQAAAQAGQKEPDSNLPPGINYCCPYQPLPSGCN